MLELDETMTMANGGREKRTGKWRVREAAGAGGQDRGEGEREGEGREWANKTVLTHPKVHSARRGKGERGYGEVECTVGSTGEGVLCAIVSIMIEE